MMDTLEIPKGFYCYGINGTCPYWHLNPLRGEQNNGYCSYLKRGDWDENNTSLLWDQIKECNINDYTDEELLEEILEAKSDICNLIKDNGGLT